jgi:DNA-binding transcriptional ArsR family regulator
MENYSASLDTAFHALSDPTRRAVVSRLMRGPAPVKELAAPFDMGLPSFMKHLRVLEASGLIRSEKVGRVRTCHMRAAQLVAAETWLAEQRALWEAGTDRLADYVENQMSWSEDDGGEDDDG